MIFYKPEISFKVKTLETCINDVCEICFIESNSHYIKDIKQFLNINDVNEKIIREKLGEIYSKNFEKAEQHAKELQDIWEKYENFVLSQVNSILGVESGADLQAWCLVDVLPFTNFDLYNKTICLPYTNTIDENVKIALPFLIKCMLLIAFLSNDIYRIDLKYSINNRYWIMADLVVDAIFNATDLKKLNDKPAYKFYYNLIIEKENVIEKVRQKYKEMSLVEFMKWTLTYITKNLKDFNYFKNRY